MSFRRCKTGRGSIENNSLITNDKINNMLRNVKKLLVDNNNENSINACRAPTRVSNGVWFCFIYFVRTYSRA